MAFYDLASYNSFWQGIEYFESNAVKEMKGLGGGLYEAKVQGSKLYTVVIDINHPRKSSCDCPYAKNNRKVCKHKIALYFTLFPDEAQEFIKERNEYWKEQEEIEKRINKKMKEVRAGIKEYLDSLSNEEVRKMLLNMMANEEYESIVKEEKYINGYDDDEYRY